MLSTEDTLRWAPRHQAAWQWCLWNHFSWLTEGFDGPAHTRKHSDPGLFQKLTADKHGTSPPLWVNPGKYKSPFWVPQVLWQGSVSQALRRKRKGESTDICQVLFSVWLRTFHIYLSFLFSHLVLCLQPYCSLWSPLDSSTPWCLVVIIIPHIHLVLFTLPKKPMKKKKKKKPALTVCEI